MPLIFWCHTQKMTCTAHLKFYYYWYILKWGEKRKSLILPFQWWDMLKMNLELILALFSWVENRILAKSEVMNFLTFVVIIRFFRWAVHVIFWVWHQNRSGILQVSTKSDYTELINLIWPLFPNFIQSIVYFNLLCATWLKLSSIQEAKPNKLFSL